jgi:hypothetical protein
MQCCRTRLPLPQPLALQLDWLGHVHILFDRRLDPGGAAATLDHRLHLIVEHNAAPIEVGGAGGPPNAGHHRQLGGHHGIAHFVDMHAGFQQVAIGCPGGG